MKRYEKLKNMIENEQIDQAIKMVRDIKDYDESEKFVFTVLREKKSTPELVEAVLETFLGARENSSTKHGYWVHSLSHFTKILWKRRIDGWIKKFYEVAFKGSNELHTSNCLDRLVDDFVYCARFNDDPSHFSLTPENMFMINSELTEYAKARIETGCFESEESFLRWKLHQPATHTAFDYDAQTVLVNLDGIRSLIQQLQELGANTSEFNGLEKKLLNKKWDELKAKLSTTTQGWKRERLEKGIQKTRDALA